MPDANWVILETSRGPTFARSMRHFGPAGNRNNPRLRKGDNDLGIIFLPSRGALRGQVVDHQGAPVENASVRFLGPISTEGAIFTRTDSRGVYVLGHIPGGKVSLTVRKSGYLSQTKEGLEVVNGTTRRGPRFELALGPSIEGLILDEEGKPLSGVRLYGAPQDSGSGRSVVTEADGSFVLPLQVDKPHYLRVQNADPYRDWGGRKVDGAVFAPNTKNLRIQLTRADRLRLRVIDALSEKPVEHFGLTIAPDQLISWGFGGADHVPEYHERGECNVPLELGKDSLVVYSEGYIPGVLRASQIVIGDSPQVIHLRRGGVVRGRLLLDGQPVFGAQLSIKRAKLRTKNEGGPRIPDPTTGKSTPFDVHPLHGRLTSHPTNPEGSFSISGLALGTYKVEVKAPGCETFILGPVTVSKEACDLGDLALTQGGTLRGRALLGPGVSTVGMNVHIKGKLNKSLRIDRHDGEFQFSELIPGKYQVVLEASPPKLAEDLELSVTMHSGASPEVILDGSGIAACPLEIQVTRSNGSLGGMKVSYGRLEGSTIKNRVKLGATDKEGFFSALLDSDEQTVVMIHLGRLDIYHSEPFAAIPGRMVRLEPDIVTGTLSIQFPAHFTPPTLSSLSVTLTRVGQGPSSSSSDRSQSLAPNWQRIVGRSRFDFPSTWTLPVCEVGELMPGTYTIQAESLYLEGPGFEGVSSFSGRFKALWEPEVRGRVIIDPDKTTVFQVHIP